MKIGIIGYGKMGKEIEKIALERGHEIPLKISSSNLDDLNSDNLNKIDVAIEFTRPENAVENIKLCIDNHVPVVIGTTGWYDDFEMIETYCQQNEGCILPATNCSIGVNVFFKVNEVLAKMMNKQADYEVTVEETHHVHKKDAPSGTAITIAEGILDNLSRKNNWINESAENQNDLSIISYREDEVPGTHKVTYSSDIDDIEITHTANNRKGFALGAVVAAEWLKNKTGIFTMDDVLFN